MSLRKLDTIGDEPISLNFTKSYLRVEHDDDDGLITDFIKTARSTIEAYTSRALCSQAWEFRVNAGFAVARSDGEYLSQSKSRGNHGLELPRSPFQDLSEAPSLETSYGVKTLTDFRVDKSGRTARIHFGPTALSLFDGSGTICIRFQAGYEPDDLPASLKQAMLLIVSQLYNNRMAVNDNPGLLGAFDSSVLQLLKPYQIKRVS